MKLEAAYNPSIREFIEKGFGTLFCILVTPFKSWSIRQSNNQSFIFGPVRVPL